MARLASKQNVHSARVAPFGDPSRNGANNFNIKPLFLTVRA
jgi:hypothetical protein